MEVSDLIDLSDKVIKKYNIKKVDANISKLMEEVVSTTTSLDFGHETSQEAKEKAESARIIEDRSWIIQENCEKNNKQKWNILS